METLKIQLYSLKKAGNVIEFRYPYNDNSIVVEFLNIFSNNADHTNKTILLDCKYQNSIELQNRLNCFIEKYKEKNPSIQRFKKFFVSLSLDEWFFIFPYVKLSTRQKYEMENELRDLNDKKNIVSDKFIEDTFSDVLNNYEQKSFDLQNNGKIRIGKNKKSERICRFCKLQIPETTFKKEAHAISEALGNKKIILNEECDNCNEFFDKNIERDFISYHDFSRTLCGIKNKSNSTPKMKGDNFDFFQDSKNSISILIKENSKNSLSFDLENFTLETGKQVRPQNIYKSMCKFALSVIDTSYLVNFDKLISWLNSEIEVEELPKVVVYNSKNFIAVNPEIILFIRNNDNYDLPNLVVQFKFAFFTYIFIVPFSSEDRKTFLEVVDYNIFLDCFRHIKIGEGFSYLNLSSNEKVGLIINLNLEESTLK